ncbi:MAG: hypothetical protein CL573_07320 [Alphaproteobacteria bacterium]|nr:hypothetical protein [Alphaproteobacteria bacterium]HCP01006.1 hypothetical protein [Rhodospirillaceae bacterium]
MTEAEESAVTETRALSGIDRFIADEPMIRRLAGTQIGMLTNHAATTIEQVPASLAVQRNLDTCGGKLLRLFTPEHGIRLAEKAGAVVKDTEDQLTGLSVLSLYQGSQGYAANIPEDLDTLIIDLRDVGVRCYTYAATAAKLATAAIERDIEVIVCDRANPLGPTTAGPRPQPERQSLLAYFDVPFVHGLTIGDLITLDVAELAKQARFTVYPADVSLKPPLGWTPPSPALPHPDAVTAYAGLVLLEATNVSECRGTSFSFRAVAVPGLKNELLSKHINQWMTGFGAAPKDIFFTRPPYAGKSLPGVVIWTSKGLPQKPLAFGIHLLAWLIAHYPDFKWLPSSEGGFAIDNLFGHSDLRTQLDAGASGDDILGSWRD